jgi:hypothetical protein
MPESAYERARRMSTPVEEFTGDQYVAHAAYEKADSEGRFHENPDLENQMWSRVVDSHNPYRDVHPDDVSDKSMMKVNKTAVERHGDFLQNKYGNKDSGFSETSSYTNN